MYHDPTNNWRLGGAPGYHDCPTTPISAKLFCDDSVPPPRWRFQLNGVDVDTISGLTCDPFFFNYSTASLAASCHPAPGSSAAGQVRALGACTLP
jgi:hypothetical protein